MKLKTVRARQGVQWVRAGFRVFLRQPLGYSALFVLIAFGALLLLQLPLLGPVLALSLMPFATVVFLLATRETLAGRAPRPGLLLVPLRQREQRRRLLQLGAIYAAATLAVVLLAHLVDGGRFAEAVAAMGEERLTREMLDDPWLEFSVLLRLALMVLLSLAFWHAPALVCWAALPPAKAVFASVVACWASRGAFALYGCAWFLVLLAGLLLLQLPFALLGQPQLSGQAALPVVMLLSTVFYASLYFSFADSFELVDPAVAPALPPSDPA